MQYALSFLCFGFCFGLSFSSLSIMVRKIRANKKTTSTSTPTFDSERFRFEKNQETYEKLNIFRSVWAKKKVILDELDPEIRRNFERRGWLPLLDISHPPPATLIREFYLNLFVHSYDANTLVRSWVRLVGYTITLLVVADALGYQWSGILSTLMMSLLPWMISCLISLGLLSSGVLILGSPLLSLL